jgi:hypothetical protein
MDEPRIRVVVDVSRRAPTDEERERRERAVRNTPNAVGGPFESVWTWSVRFEPLPGEADASSHNFRHNDEAVVEIIAWVKQAVAVGLARRLSERRVPVDRRFADLIGVERAPARSEVAEKVAELSGLPKPTRAATEALLVDLALLAHRWYDDPYAPTEQTHVGHGIVSAAASEMTDRDFRTALDDLGLKDDVRLWTVAADLVKRMGVPVW